MTAVWGRPKTCPVFCLNIASSPRGRKVYHTFQFLSCTLHLSGKEKKKKKEQKMSHFIVPSEWQPDRRTRDGLPLQFEDRTGYITNTDFDDMYDRMHFHVSRLPGQTSTKIFRMGFRPSRVRNSLPLPPNPEVSLDFGPHEALGTISLSLMQMSYTVNLPMTQYLQKTSRSFFAR